METREDINAIVATAGSVLAAAASAIGLLTAFGYVISYKYLQAFYSTIGTPWALDLYPPTQIIQNAAPIAVALTGTGFAIWNLGPNWAEKKAKFKEAIIPGAIAGILYAIHLIISRYFTNYVSYFHFAAILVGLVATTVVVTAFVSRVFEIQGKRGAAIVFILGTGALIFLFADVRGSSHARDAMNGTNNRGNPVTLTGDRSQASYRLIRVIPYERALIATSSDDEPVFRVVEITDLVSKKPQSE